MIPGPKSELEQVLWEKFRPRKLSSGHVAPAGLGALSSLLPAVSSTSGCRSTLLCSEGGGGSHGVCAGLKRVCTLVAHVVLSLYVLQVLRYFDYVFTGVFTFEMVIKVKCS